MGEGPGDPDWQRVPCRLADFLDQINYFLDDLKALLEREAPAEMAIRWWRVNVGTT